MPCTQCGTESTSLRKSEHSRRRAALTVLLVREAFPLPPSATLNKSGSKCPKEEVKISYMGGKWSGCMRYVHGSLSAAKAQKTHSALEKV